MVGVLEISKGFISFLLDDILQHSLGNYVKLNCILLFDGEPLDPEDKHLGSESWNKWFITTHFQEPCLGAGVRNQPGSPDSQLERRWRQQ